jgi:serine/threonine-protein kinase
MTPEYASPEQLRGAAITTASDVYQLGILLHELLTGRRPQTAADGLPALHDIADRDMANIVRMAVDPDANRRYESAEQLRDDVRRYLAGQPVIARAATLGYRARKFIMRHKTGTAMSAALVLIVLASAGLAFTQARNTARERDHAEQVSVLLQDLFASSDPTVTAGDTITVRAVLERGAARLAADARLDAGVRARLLAVIASAYQNLGLLDRAIALQSEAVTALQGVLPADHPNFLQSRRLLGGMKAEDGQAKAVLPMLDSVLSIVQKKRRQNRGELAAALHITAWAHQLNQETDTARALYERALFIYRSMPADSGMRMVATLVNLGALARDRDDLESAEQLYREALALRRARLGNEHPLTAASMTALAATLLDRDKLDEAEQLARAALAIQRRTLPSPHLDLAGNIELQASLLTRRGQFSEAEPLQREALAMYRALYGDRHMTVAHGTANLGSIVQRQGRLDEAVELQRAAADLYGSVAGARSLSTGVALSNLAYTEFLRRRLPESEALYRTALPVLDSLLKGSARLASLYADFSIVLAQQGKCDQAEPHARRSYELARARLPENNVDVIRPQRVLGQCLVFLQRYSNAEPLLLDAHRKLQAGWGAANMYTVAAAQDLVQLYERWGRKQEADRFRR